MYQGIHLEVLETDKTSSASVVTNKEFHSTEGSSKRDTTDKSSFTLRSTFVQTSEMLHFKDTKISKERPVTTEATQIKGKVIARILTKKTVSIGNEEIPTTTTTGFSTKEKTDQFASESTSVQTNYISRNLSQFAKLTNLITIRR